MIPAWGLSQGLKLRGVLAVEQSTQELFEMMAFWHIASYSGSYNRRRPKQLKKKMAKAGLDSTSLASVRSTELFPLGTDQCLTKLDHFTFRCSSRNDSSVYHAFIWYCRTWTEQKKSTCTHSYMYVRKRSLRGRRPDSNQRSALRDDRRTGASILPG